MALPRAMSAFAAARKTIQAYEDAPVPTSDISGSAMVSASINCFHNGLSWWDLIPGAHSRIKKYASKELETFRLDSKRQVHHLLLVLLLLHQ
jgi:hypothetical protein